MLLASWSPWASGCCRASLKSSAGLQWERLRAWTNPGWGPGPPHGSCTVGVTVGPESWPRPRRPAILGTGLRVANARPLGIFPLVVHARDPTSSDPSGLRWAPGGAGSLQPTHER